MTTSTSSANATALPSDDRGAPWCAAAKSPPRKRTRRGSAVARIVISVGQRRAIEEAIERLIGILDLVDPDPELEETGDLEPSLGAYYGRYVDGELDQSDDEPSLGSLDRAINQSVWSGPDCVNASLDLELQPYVSVQRRLGFPSYELTQRERNETRRLAQELSAIVAKKCCGAKASSRAARRIAR